MSEQHHDYDSAQRRRWLFSDIPNGATASAQLYLQLGRAAKANDHRPMRAASRPRAPAAGRERRRLRGAAAAPVTACQRQQCKAQAHH